MRRVLSVQFAPLGTHVLLHPQRPFSLLLHVGSVPFPPSGLLCLSFIIVHAAIAACPGAAADTGRVNLSITLHRRG